MVQAITFGGVADRVPAELLPLLASRDVIVGYDGDQAGDAGFEQVRGVLPNARRMRPTHGKDLTELHGQIGLKNWYEQLL